MTEGTTTEASKGGDDDRREDEDEDAEGDLWVRPCFFFAGWTGFLNSAVHSSSAPLRPSARRLFRPHALHSVLLRRHLGDSVAPQTSHSLRLLVELVVDSLSSGTAAA